MRTIQALLGHEEITTTEIYLHVAIGANGLGAMSPLDRMATMDFTRMPDASLTIVRDELAPSLCTSSGP